MSRRAEIARRRSSGSAHAKVLAAALVIVAGGARAESERIVLGTHDAVLASAISVAVSPRGLSVVELPEPLRSSDDVAVAHREIGVSGTVAVVWLCDDPRFEHALCFCGRDGHLVVRAVSVTTPLAPPAAAAVALSVKMLLGPVPGAQPAPPPARPRVPAIGPPRIPEEPARSTLPALVVELDAGARAQPVADGHLGARVGVAAAFAPEWAARRLAVGAHASAGQPLAVGGDQPAGRTLSDVRLGVLARGRAPSGRAWLELDLGPSVHVLSVAAGASAPARVDLSLDAAVGLILPFGRTLVGARAGGFAIVTSPVASAPALPRWNGELLLTVGRALR